MLSKLPPLVLWFLLCLVAFCGLNIPYALAQTKQVVSPPEPGNSGTLNVTVSGQVNETGLELKGWSAPNAFLIVTDETEIVGTGTAQNNGTFDFLIHALQANSTHTITITADNGNERTPGTSFVVTVPGTTIVTVSNILVPTFFDVSPQQANPGSPINVSGTTVPGGLVTIYVQNPLQSVQVTADATTGAWSTDLNADFGPFSPGTYTTFASVSYNSVQSNNSRQIQFIISNVPSTTKLTANGFGAPGSFLLFRYNGDIVGTTTVLSDGSFSETITFPDANATVTVSILGDNGNQVTPATTFTATLQYQQTTTVNNILLPSFIAVSPPTAPQGQSITVSGQGAPGASVDLTIATPTQTTTTTIDGVGNWSKELISTFGTLPEGAYTAQVVLHKSGGMTSVPSQTVTFVVSKSQSTTSLTVQGYGAPGAFLSFTNGVNVVGTGQVNPDGSFSQNLQFPDQTQQYTISVTQSDNVEQTPSTGFVVTLPVGVTTTVSNLVLPTFIDMANAQVPYGSPILVTGTGVPNATISLYAESPLQQTTVTTASDGTWSANLIDKFGIFPKGAYKTYGKTTFNNADSVLSNQLLFTVASDQCSDRRSDLNCDGKVDITDVGILLFYWGINGAGQKADINQDGVVDISDVGIMLYDWTN